MIFLEFDLSKIDETPKNYVYKARPPGLGGTARHGITGTLFLSKEEYYPPARIIAALKVEYHD